MFHGKLGQERLLYDITMPMEVRSQIPGAGVIGGC